MKMDTIKQRKVAKASIWILSSGVHPGLLSTFNMTLNTLVRDSVAPSVQGPSALLYSQESQDTGLNNFSI